MQIYLVLGIGLWRINNVNKLNQKFSCHIYASLNASLNHFHFTAYLWWYYSGKEFGELQLDKSHIYIYS